MRTVFDVLRENDGKGVLVHRHGSYVSGYGGVEELDGLADIYSRRSPDVLHHLDHDGISISTKQGALFADYGLIPAHILTSDSIRGVETGTWFAHGIAKKTGSLPTVTVDFTGANYPVYDRDIARRLLEEVGNAMVVQWLKGKHDSLCKETSTAFTLRVTDHLSMLTDRKELAFVGTHFENVVLIWNLFVAQRSIANFDEGYEPHKSGGVLLVRKDGGDIVGYEYQPSLIIAEPR